MENKPLKSFCCGCSLRTGTLIIGGVLALNAAVSLILFIYFFNADFKTLINNPKTYSNKDYHLVPSFVPILKSLLIVLTTLSVVQLIINLVLLFGTLKDIPSLVYLWLKFYVALIAANLVADILNAILYYSITSSGATGMVFSMLGTIGNLMVTVYAILVVNAYHGTMNLGRPQYSRGAGPAHGDLARLI